jgi:RHS repeat-associated protein
MRLTTDTNGSATATSGHFPFGESWYETGGTNKLKFTPYERDSESGNDYAMFRKYVPRLGRFCSADRLAGKTSNPQSLNRFAYALNDPVNLIDPLGLEVMCITWEVYTCRDVVLASDEDRGWQTVCEYVGEFSGGCYGFSGGGFGGGGGNGGGGGGGSAEDILRAFAENQLELARKGTITDCDALLRIFGAAFGLFDSREEAVDALARVLTERNPHSLDPNNARPDARSTTVGVYGPSQVFGDTGFQSQFQDGGNQVRHFMGYFNAGFHSGAQMLLAGGRALQEFLSGDTPDARLGVRGINLGDAFRATSSPNSFLGSLRGALCDH